MQDSMNPTNLLNAIIELSWDTADAILPLYKKPITINFKADQSPVTHADLKAHSIIINGLKKLTPHIPTVSEEDPHLPSKGYPLFWLIDPIDGTKSFIRRTGEFTINIALIQDQNPILGAICLPTQEICYAGIQNYKAFKIKRYNKQFTELKTQDYHDLHKLKVIGSRTQGLSDAMKRYLLKFEKYDFFSASSSLKFCLVAENKADIYPRFGTTMEWDTAAGHAILRAAGGEIYTLPDFNILTYSKPGFVNPHFIATSLSREIICGI